MDLSIVNHLFLTQRFLVKGNVRTGDLRLSSFLNSVRRPWLAIENATLIDLRQPDRVFAKTTTLRLEDVVLAHEFLDLAGDPLRKSLAVQEQNEFRMLSVYFRSPCRLELLGRARHDAVDAGTGDEFFVVMEPLLRGFDDKDATDVQALKNMNYAIVNRRQVHCFFQYE
jgi:hypothetical protein